MTSVRDEGLGVDPGTRTLRHPGPPAQERVIALPTRLTRHDVELPEGKPLLQALEDLLDRTAAVSAHGQLVGGEMREFSYYIPDIGPAGGPVATFSRPYLGAAPGSMTRGGITIGRRDGGVWCHSHSLFRDADGVERAGHLIPDKVVLGKGVRAQVWTGSDVLMEVQPDPETAMPLFTPRRVSSARKGDVEAIVCRVRPNVDITRMIEWLTAEQGWDDAEVSGQVGSLAGGRLQQADGSIVDVDGPATEVMFVEGTVSRVGGDISADLRAHLVDRHACVHNGTLVRGQNAVALTYELVLTQASS